MSDRAYVHVWPPDSTRPLLAAQVIVMATGNGGFCRFKYAAEYLDHPDAFALDPVALPLEARVFESEPDFELFSALRDAGPDYWGRKVIERRLDRQGLTELDFLLAGGSQHVGALGFSESREPPDSEGSVDIRRLEELLVASERLDRGEALDRETLALLGEGSGTLGGMRPKTTVSDRNGLWLAKFPARDDRNDVVRMEFLALELASDSDIEVPEHRLELVADRPVLLLRRFDRRQHADGARIRLHYLSGLTMTGLHERDYARGSYADLADWLRQHGQRPLEDSRALYRRMLFNIMIGNTDDHLRNHAVIRDADGYRLSPAFDLVPDPTLAQDRRQAIGVGESGRAASRENALSGAPRFALETAEAEAIAQEVADAVSSWRTRAAPLDLDRSTIRALEQAIRAF